MWQLAPDFSLSHHMDIKYWIMGKLPNPQIKDISRYWSKGRRSQKACKNEKQIRERERERVTIFSILVHLLHTIPACISSGMNKVLALYTDIYHMFMAASEYYKGIFSYHLWLQLWMRLQLPSLIWIIWNIFITICRLYVCMSNLPNDHNFKWSVVNQLTNFDIWNLQYRLCDN